MSLRRFRKLLSPEVLQQMRTLRKRFRHLRWRARTTFYDSIITEEEIVNQLLLLGVSGGQDLLVHSALSQIGFVEGGADAVVNALLAAVGANGTLLMPAYPMTGSMLETVLDGRPFDVRQTPSTMGKLTEAFRARSGALRSAHPTHSVVALGPRASKYVHHHHLCRSPFGPGSPFWLLSEFGGAILSLGTGIGKVTSHHVIEEIESKYPLPVYLSEAYTKQVRLTNGELLEVETLVHDPRLAAVRIDSNEEIEAEVLEEMRHIGIIREGMIGQAKTYLFNAASLNDFHKKRLALGKTIYGISSYFSIHSRNFT